ncbi:MAG: efflux RND transporter periplasmic adaptor subunit [Gammaproteobacteria bacterium]|nr:efflux RND transporter periplasmic adaptor subunit [Gammaproteobacteria bacterium]
MLHSLPALLLLAAPGLALAGEAPGPAPAMPVEAVTVQAETLSQRLKAVGSLRADEAVVVRPEIAGRLATIHFREGEAVKAGRLLFELDAEVLTAEAQRAEAERRLAQLEFERMSQLLKRKAGSRTDYDKAQAALRAAEAELALASAQLKKTRISAPFDGTLGLRQVSAGDYLAPGQDLVSLTASQSLKLDFRLPETELARVRPGQSLSLRVDAYPDREFAGELYAVEPQIEAGGRALVLRARLANPEGLLKPGLFARVELEVARREGALRVPEEALLPGADGSLSVFKIVDGKIVAAPVKTGRREDARVEITEGISAGDSVVTAGQMKVGPGSPVSVMPSTPASPSSPKQES